MTILRKFQHFSSFYLYTAFCILLGVAILTIARISLYYTFGDHTLFEQFSGDLQHSFVVGFLFDLKICAIIFCAFYILSLLSLLWKDEKAIQKLEKIYPICALIILTTILFIAILNQYFYGITKTHISIMLFQLVDDDTRAIFSSVWTDYPVVKLTVFIVLTGVAIRYLLKFAFKIAYKIKLEPSIFMQVILVVFSFLIYAAVVRGSFDRHQLKFPATSFSNNSLVNQATLNGVGALFFAVYNRMHDVQLVLIKENEARKAFRDYFSSSRLKNFNFNALYAATPKRDYLEKNPPMVVFTQMEGMGVHFYLYNTEKNNLLGRLAPHIQQDYFFTHFLSATITTLGSMVHFVVKSPYMNVSESSLRDIHYLSSVAKPFKEAGYKTYFLSAGEAGWRDLTEFLLKQDFDKVIGSETILEKYPDAETEAWGVYDEYVFKYAYDLLQEANKKHEKVFLYINTVSNHSPYTIPRSYKPYPITVPAGLPERVARSEDYVRAMFATYQYGNDCLGAFMDNIKHSAFAEKIIVGASGDHNQHEMIAHYPNYHESALQYSVPFYLYVPKYYRQGVSLNTQRVGSHKDIFPTLYYLALSNAHYMNLGNNLAAAKNDVPDFGYYPDMMIIPEGIIQGEKKPLFYPWLNEQKFLVGTPKPLNEAQMTYFNKIKAYEKLLYWQFQYQAAAKLKENSNVRMY